MRVLQVVESLERGGLERVVADLSTGLARRGHDVEVACMFRGGPLVAELEQAGIPVRVLGKRRGLDLRCAREFRRCLAAARPDVVHTHNAFCGYYPALAALGSSRARWISTRHGMGESRASARKERLYRASLRRYAHVTAVCEAAARAFAPSFGTAAARLAVVPNGIRLDRFAPPDAERRAERRRELGLPAETAVVGAVGRLNAAKNFPRLVRAYASVRGNLGPTQLVIVGEGAARREIESAIHDAGVDDHVRLLGDRRDVPRLLEAFDVYACSSDTEGYSIALLEAAAAGLPTVATDVGGNREIVQSGRTGEIVPAGDEAAFAAALARWLGDPVRRRTAGQAAREWALAHAGVDSMVEAFGRLYADGR